MWKDTPRDSTAYRLIVSKCQQGRLNIKGGCGDLALILDPKKLFQHSHIEQKEIRCLTIEFDNSENTENSGFSDPWTNKLTYLTVVK